MNPLILIGTGVAGYTFAKSWRQLDSKTPLTIITEDDGTFYSKPLLSNVFSKGKTPDSLAMSDATTMAKQLNAEIVALTEVTAIDTDAHTLTTKNGSRTYGKLVLATGAEPITLPLNGDSDQLWRVNSLTHYRDFHHTLLDKKSLAIIGCGLIGCEFANDAVHAGKSVTLIGMEEQLLQGLIPRGISDVLLQKLNDAGVTFLPQKKAASINASNNGVTLSLDCGKTVSADLCLAAVGIRPRVELAQSANIATNKGILVDDTLATSAADVYAIGDGVEFNDSVLPYIAPILLQARTLAAHLGNAENYKPLSYPAMPITIKTPIYPMTCLPPKSEGHWKIDEDANGMRARCFNDKDELIGFALSEQRCRERIELVSSLK